MKWCGTKGTTKEDNIIDMVERSISRTWDSVLIPKFIDSVTKGESVDARFYGDLGGK